ncbi:TonB-dependent receptor [Sphingomonas sp. S2-65]|uniref:TonB-dependent receptor n=1 Tax=Sphingomonas sp. S2-65 TaxID=2903960 RepID=UPI001F1AA387|nr:TonB-dependent receptor [Sphingomonas sp. S2-65]UYY59501.1 TonB-dependent receptor [Sphingomonas sp. S2-65]
MGFASLGALALAMAFPAAAQVASPPDSTDDGEVVVTGSALRNQETISQRRKALGIVDSIGQDDTGDLADETLAEALIRLPGVNDMQTLYGEQTAKYMSIRGISPDLNFVSFDGIGMFSASNDGAGSRRVDLALIPTQVAQTTQVYKTFTADLDGGVIGGATNIVPYSALDGRNQWNLDARVEYRPSSTDVDTRNALGDYADTKFGGSIKGLIVQRFGAQDQFGVVASASYTQESWTASKPNINARTYLTAAGRPAKEDLSDWDGNAAMPNRVRTLNYTKFRKLYGGYLGLEYRAAPNVTLSASAFDYRQDEDQTLNDYRVDSIASPVYSSPNVARMKIGVIRPFVNYDRFATESRGAILKTRWEIDPATVLELRGAYGLSTFDNTDLGAAYTYSPAADFVTFDMSKPRPTFEFSNPADMVNLANYRAYSAADSTNAADFESWEGRGDLRHNYSSDSLGLGFAAGVDFRTVDAARDMTTTNYVVPASAIGAIGFVPGNASFGFPYQTVYVDLAKFNAQVKPSLAVNPASSASASFASDYGYRESILAGYANAMFAADRTRIIAGVRIEDVDYRAKVPQRVGTVFNGTEQRYDGGYRYALPSVSVTQDFSDTLRLRAAYSKSLGRPAFSDIAQAELVNNESLTITKGNPDLRPRKADNFDLALEQYFNGGDGLVALSGFYKKIDDEIFELRTTQDRGGILYDVTTPLNATSASLKGIELQFIDNDIAWLPGPLRNKMGVSFNVARMWAHMSYVSGGNTIERDNLLFQPDWVINASTYFKLPGDGELRVAYRWADKNLNTVNAQPYADYVLKARGQMDASLRLPITERVIVKLEANNLLGNDYSMMHGYFSERYTLTQDRKFFAGIVFKN